MGNQFSVEQKLWKNAHYLATNKEIQETQIQQLVNFKKQLYLCYNDRKLFNVNYQHWFVTDKTWTIEFILGDKNFTSANVVVHSNPSSTLPIIEEEFVLTPEVKERMMKVCGAKNYSIALRNCEHVARYIYSGSWISLQMAGDGILRKKFFSKMAESTRHVNTLPYDLKEEDDEMHTMYPGVKDAIWYTGHSSELTEGQNEMFNILLLGPTGAGKSNLINQMFNKTVSKSLSGAGSVTKEIRYVHGNYEWPFEWQIDKKWRKISMKVNVIDTIGFCDSYMAPKEVVDVVKMSVKVNLVYIDKIVVVCSGRLQKDHQNTIKKFMEWLRYSKYKDKFTFIYNKCEGLTVADKQRNLMEVCDLIGIDSAATRTAKHYLPSGETTETSHKLVHALGFPPGATLNNIENDREKLMSSVLQSTNLHHIFPKFDNSKRVPVSESMCSIL